jgi:heme exporter protein D
MQWKHLIAPVICLLIVAMCAVAYVQQREDRLRSEMAVQERDAVMAERPSRLAAVQHH